MSERLRLYAIENLSLRRLDSTYPSITDFPVGFEFRMQHVIDKTTIAKAIFN